MEGSDAMEQNGVEAKEWRDIELDRLFSGWVGSNGTQWIGSNGMDKDWYRMEGR